MVSPRFRRHLLIGTHPDPPPPLRAHVSPAGAPLSRPTYRQCRSSPCLHPVSRVPQLALDPLRGSRVPDQYRGASDCQERREQSRKHPGCRALWCSHGIRRAPPVSWWWSSLGFVDSDAQVAIRVFLGTRLPKALHRRHLSRGPRGSRSSTRRSSPSREIRSVASRRPVHCAAVGWSGQLSGYPAADSAQRLRSVQVAAILQEGEQTFRIIRADP